RCQHRPSRPAQMPLPALPLTSGPCFSLGGSQESVLAAGEAISILVIDDHPVFRAGVAAALARLEGSPVVQEAGSVAEAWAALETNPPACATLDLQLGQGNGFTLLVKARARGLPTRFVVVSLFDDEALRARAMALGASG